ncbi:WD40-repeat-containing domain protein [Mycena rebaudengoi]|nr:WD40-repeat-containing domain protein [Mycena rebaudengoi]
MQPSAEYTWTPPEFDLSRKPQLSDSFNVVSDDSDLGNFGRSAKWCPDGSVALTHCENRTFQLFTPTSMVACDGGASHSPPKPLQKTFYQPAPILDFIWYPTATVTDPASFCFVSSVRETPVKLLDASDGRLRASYRIVDHRERQIAPHSLAFNLSATKLYCGFEDAIEVFDILRPGEGTRLPTTPSKKSKDGLKGIISALAFSPSYESDFYAAGSLAATHSNIAMFSESEGEVPVMFVGGGPRGAGVTQLQFNPLKPHILYASFRRRREIYSWDLRADVNSPLGIYSASGLTEVPRLEDTNQKLRFDIDVGGRHLSVGDQEGKISVFELSEPETQDTAEVPVISPRLMFNAHQDAIGSVTFHPTRSMLLSVAGSRHFETPADNSDSPQDEHDEVDIIEPRNAGVRRRAAQCMPVPFDATMKLWDFEGAGEREVTVLDVQENVGSDGIRSSPQM